ncbi:hypothetical protein PSAR109036_01970 [Psychrobacter arenosus]|uniref:hypothetical protein n=1 Tax=Psychrobacter arenosus TaxID=256326 RepID=UPI0019183E3A|nr:hypothetical protein [Psychrobacter arenosus]
MNSILLSSAHLRALLLFAAKHDPRRYLEGICFFGNPGKLLAFATNGHVMARYVVDSNYSGPVFKHLISSRDIKLALYMTGDAAEPYEQAIRLDVASGCLVDFEGDRLGHTDDLDVSSYPNPQRVIDQLISADNKQHQNPVIQPKYFKLLAKVGKLFVKQEEDGGYYGGAPRLYKASNTSGNIFTFDNIPDFMCVIMPMRLHELHNEHKAVLMSDYAGDPVRQVIKDGKWAWCSVSNSHDLHLAACRHTLRRLVAYDDECYMDAGGETWKYAALVDVDSKETN